MKKLLALFLALVMCLATCMLTSCQNGRDGKDGTNGKDGSNGKSAYDIAVEYGFKGTEEEWLASLKTEKDPNADSIGLDFTLSEDETYYILSGVGYNDDIVINIPAGYNGLPVKEIGNSAFKNYNWVRKINIPDGVTTIGREVFYNCAMLKEINIPQTVTGIGHYAFYGCTGLTSITIPDSVTSIGDYAFNGCTGLTSVHISSIEAWNNIVFGSAKANPLYYAHNLYLNENLITDLIIPNGVTKIGYHAFSDCSGLTSITIPDSVTSIGEYAFSYCSGLTSITIPDSVTSIGYAAFSSCSGLTSVTIGNGVTNIGDAVFYRCSRLTTINYSGTKAEWNAVEKTNAYIPSGVSVICTDGTITIE